MNENVRTPVIINVYNGAGSIFTVDLSVFGKDIVTFGRNPDNDIYIEAAALSERHGFFQFTNVGWVVFDNQSENGIIVNGAKRKNAQLNNGTEIRIINEIDKSVPAITLLVEEKDASSDVSAIPENATDNPGEPQRKKSKAPIIVVAILVPLLVIGLIIALLIVLFFLGWHKYFKPVDDATPNVDNAYVEEYSEYSEYIEEIETEPETEIETQAPVELPPRVPTSTDCEQFVLVECDGTYATLTFYEKEEGVWVEKLVSNGRIGKNGITKNKREGDGCTPAGEFDLTFCCGLSDPGTDMDFQTINEYSVWVDDVNSYYYNTLQDSDNYYKDWDSAEPMYNSYFKDGRHNYCISIAANGDGMSTDGVVSGGGSVITLCGKNDTIKETQGCVDISDEDMLDLLSYLDSQKHPVIIIY